MTVQAHPTARYGAPVLPGSVMVGMVGVALVGLIVIVGTPAPSQTALIHRPAAEEKALADFRLSEKAPSQAELRAAEAKFRLSEK